MRYWIYLNELVQGPFELDELIELHAFNEGLPVCMEDRQEWLPAGRVADLAPSLELLRTRHIPPPPPPPPPSHPPSATPLQGEFFSDPPGQRQLFEKEEPGKGPFAYAPVLDFPVESGAYPTATVTMPIRFGTVKIIRDDSYSTAPETFLKTQSGPALMEPPRPIEIPPLRVIRETPRAETVLPPEVISWPVQTQQAVRAIEELPVREPETSQEIPSLLLRRSSFDFESHASPTKTVIGIMILIMGLAALMSSGYWMLDHYNTRSAIAEATRSSANSHSGSQGTVQAGHAQSESVVTGNGTIFEGVWRAAARLLSLPTAGGVDQNSAAGGGSSAWPGAESGNPSGHYASAQGTMGAQNSSAVHPTMLGSLGQSLLSLLPGMGGSHTGKGVNVGSSTSGDGSALNATAASQGFSGSSASGTTDGVERNNASTLTTTVGEVGQNSAAAGTSIGVKSIAGGASAFPGAESGDQSTRSSSAGGTMVRQNSSAVHLTMLGNLWQSLLNLLPGMSASRSAQNATGTSSAAARGSSTSEASQTGRNATVGADMNNASGAAFARLTQSSAVASLGSSGSKTSSAAPRSQSAQSSLIDGSATVSARGTATASGMPAVNHSMTMEPSSASSVHATSTAEAGAKENSSWTARQKSAMENLAAQPTWVGHVARVLLRWFGVAMPVTPVPFPGAAVEGVPASTASPAASVAAEPFTSHARNAKPGKSKIKSSSPSSVHKVKAVQPTAKLLHSEMPLPVMKHAATVKARAAAAPKKIRVSSSASAKVSASGTENGISASASSPSPSAAEQGSLDAVVPGVVAVPGLNPTPAATASTPAPGSNKSDPWAGRQNEAITLAMYRKICGGDATVIGQAKVMLEDMHEKELIHAADTGERLYLPDKISWTALRQEGPLYRVYLNFSALQASGERVQARSYQFTAELQQKLVNSDDSATSQDFLNKQTPMVHKHNPMADDIVSLLSGIDLLDKQKMHAIIVEKSHISKKERKSIEQAINTAEAKVERAIVYFRTKYAEEKLRNLGKAYNFTPLLEG